MNRLEKSTHKAQPLFESNSLEADRVDLREDEIAPHCKIAIFRALPGLGDFLCTIPTLRSLRFAFPQAEISFIGLPVVKPLVQRFHRYLDRLIEFPGYPGLPEISMQPQKFPIFLEKVQREKFDLILQMHGSGLITNPLTTVMGGRMNAGFFIPGQYCPDETRFLPYRPRESEVRRYVRLLEFLGIPSQGEDLEFPIWDEDVQTLRSLPEIRGLYPSRYVCIHPGASTPDRCWSAGGFARVADALARQGFRVFLTGSKSEVALAQAVAARMKAPAINLAGRTSLGTLAALLKDSRLLVCNDTGVSHLAAALGVSSTVIFTQSDPDRWAPLNRDRHRAITQTTPEAVIIQALDLLQKEKAYVA